MRACDCCGSNFDTIRGGTEVKIGHSEEAIRELGTMLELELLENEERPFKL